MRLSGAALLLFGATFVLAKQATAQQQSPLYIPVPPSAELAKQGAAQQQSPCADPNALRIGIFTTVDAKSATGPLKREAVVEERMRKSLEKKLGSERVCIIENISVFDDPKNYPLLKGSMLMQIYSRTSFDRPAVSAITVTLQATEGPSFDQNLLIGPVTILIETDTDYDIGAEDVMMIWSRMADAIKEKNAIH